jgi:hypothetical protein
MSAPIRLLIDKDKPPALTLNSSWSDVKAIPFLKEYVDAAKAAEVLALVEQEKRLIAKRIALFSTLKKEVATLIDNLTKAEINAHLLQKDPEEFL